MVGITERRTPPLGACCRRRCVAWIATSRGVKRRPRPGTLPPARCAVVRRAAANDSGRAATASGRAVSHAPARPPRPARVEARGRGPLSMLSSGSSYDQPASSTAPSDQYEALPCGDRRRSSRWAAGRRARPRAGGRSAAGGPPVSATTGRSLRADPAPSARTSMRRELLARIHAVVGIAQRRDLLVRRATRPCARGRR